MSFGMLGQIVAMITTTMEMKKTMGMKKTMEMKMITMTTTTVTNMITMN